MKILICGSRTWTDYAQVLEALRDLTQARMAPPIVIHGAARGADLLGARAAGALGLPVEAYPADWNRYGRSAGYRRNEQMVTMLDPTTDQVLAFSHGSRGTQHTIDLARARGIPVTVIGEEAQTR
jgi:hypothetical protein